MQVITHNPSKLLKQYVKHMWIIDEGGVFDLNIKSFPIGYSYINIIDGNPFVITNKGNKYQAKSYLAGPKKAFFDLNMSYVRRALTIQLQPYAIPYIFNIPASEFLGEIIPLNDFMPKLASQLEELITSDIPNSNVLKITEELLIKNLNDNIIEERVLYALQLLLKSGGDIKIRELSNHICLSERRLQQIFQYNFGLSAKAYSRIVKMQCHTFQILNGKDLDTIIPDGYYDQSHFIHELKKQTGFLPNDFYNYVNNDAHKMAYLTSNLYFKNKLL